MNFKINDLEVFFPFEIIYKEQYEYMKVLDDIVNQKINGIIEMPTGTGKTVTLFSYFISKKIQDREKIKKVIYCTRTLSQLEKATEELKTINNLLKKLKIEPPICTTISARRTLCLNEEVNIYPDRFKIDAECKKKTVLSHGNKCDYYENFMSNFSNIQIKEDVLNIEDLLELGEDKKICPYFSARSVSKNADIVICNYPYVLDEKVNDIIVGNLTSDSVLIIDEAHNIDSVCVESMSLSLDKQIIDYAFKNLETLKEFYMMENESKNEVIEREYNKLKSKISSNNQIQNLTVDLKNFDLMPGSLRKISHFFSFLKRLLNFFNNYLKLKEVSIKEPQGFLDIIKEDTHIDTNELKYANLRLDSMINTINFIEIENLAPLKMILDFGERLANNLEGFKIIFEPFYDTGKTTSPLLQLICLDPSLAMDKLVKKFDSIILTSGTISPMDFYSRILKLDKVINASIEPNWLRDSISPLIIGRASDQSLLTTAFSERGNSIISKNYGELLYELSRYVPDGIVCFFPSYSYMEEIVTDWKKLGLIEEITKNKMLFIETKDQRMTSEALQSYKNAIERGRGGIFLCVARGKVAEGVDFKNHLGRCAYVIGIPFQYTKSRALLCRTEYLENKLGINQKEYVLYDAMKQTAQCLGRVFRGKMDYGLLILADSRYNEEKISVLPKWIKNHVKPENLKLHSNIAIPLAKKFFSDMSKDYTIPKDIYYTKGDFNEN